MAQRHTIYVIANVGSNIRRYKVLAILREQWLQADEVTRQCISVLQIFDQKINLPGIARELRSASRLDWESEIWMNDQKVGRTELDKRNASTLEQDCAKEVLLPFIDTCLFASSIVEDAFGCDCYDKAMTTLLPINYAFDGHDIHDNDGITIIDITELGKPRYGFMFPHRKILLDARTYLKQQTGDLDGVVLLDGYDSIRLSAIQSTWPDSTFTELKVQWRTKPEQPFVDDLGMSAMSLKERSYATLVDEAFQTDDLSWVDEAEKVPDFTSALQSRFKANPELVFSQMGMRLLIRATAGNGKVDLSRHDLSLSQAVQVLEATWTNKKPENRILVLPTVPELNRHDLDLVLHDFKPFSLELGETPSISLSELFSTVSGSSVVEFNCSELYKRSLQVIGPHNHLLTNIPVADFPLGANTGFPIAQVVFLKATSAAPEWTRLGDGGIRWTASLR